METTQTSWYQIISSLEHIIFPTPATGPLVLRSEDAALVLAPKFESSSALIARERRSGLVVEGNRDNAIGVLFVASPE